MEEKKFDKGNLSKKIAKMDPQERRRYLERRVYRQHPELFRSEQKLEDSFFGATPPSIFVGRYGYPKVNAGILSPDQTGNTENYDRPKTWRKNNAQVEKIIGYRSNLINSREKVKVKSTEKFLDKAKEIAMASKPVDVEVELKKKPKFKLNFGERNAPFGPSESVEKVDIAENPKIPRAVDKAVGDTDWKAENAAKYLYQKDLDNYQIQRVLSAGLLGEEERRKLVPTRWSITATDDILGKGIRKEIKDYQELGEIQLYRNEYLGNIFQVILIPGKWEYELVEVKGSGSVWNPGETAFINTDYENYEGRTSYAEETAGGYYAARLGVLEKLRREQRQAKALFLREVTDEYWAPLGVWVVRETVREALEKEPINPESFNKAVEKAKKRISVPMKEIKEKSKLMKAQQSDIKKFMRKKE